MVIVAGAEERSGVTHALRDLEAEHAVVEGQRPIQVGDLQVHVADLGAGIYSLRHDIPS